MRKLQLLSRIKPHPQKWGVGKRCESLPQGVFKKRHVYSRRYWRQENFIADLFWRRWLLEYFPTLNTRSKWHWHDVHPNLSKVDFMLIADEQLHRGQWPLGIVIEQISGNDILARSAKVKFDGRNDQNKTRCKALPTRARLWYKLNRTHRFSVTRHIL